MPSRRYPRGRGSILPSVYTTLSNKQGVLRIEGKMLHLGSGSGIGSGGAARRARVRAERARVSEDSLESLRTTEGGKTGSVNGF